jgi:elongation factor P
MKANDIRNGQILRIEGKLFRVLSFQHRTPGNLRAFVQAKLRDLKSGAQNEFRFSSTEELERVSLDTRQMQYLYHDAAGYHFMDNDTYDQVALTDDVVGDVMPYVIAESVVVMEWFDGAPVGLELPAAVELKIVETAPGIKGATASAQKKPAKLETGLVVQVPSFIEEGEKIRISTETGDYLGRA